MFQYAMGRSLSLRYGFELILDDWSGFIRDKQYNRKFEINSFPIKARTAKYYEIIPSWIYKMNRKISHDKNIYFDTKWYGCFINESKNYFQPEIYECIFGSVNYVTGYWQSPLYFKDYEIEIINELNPPVTEKSKYNEIGDLIASCESVAIGLRFYEESQFPNVHTINGEVVSIKKMKDIINKFNSEKPYSRFFYFSTQITDITRELGLPKNTIYITPDNGFSDTLETLWLLTKCRHHIFNPSTFYWWGAFLSRKNHNKNNQLIYAPYNFYNRNTLSSDWISY
jgi:hypothetical protein